MAGKTPEEKAAEKAAKDQAAAEAKAAKEAEKAAADAAKAAEKAAKSSEPITVYYRDHRGMGVSRVFSADDHGENFAAVAEEFKATNATRIIADAAEGKAAAEATQRFDDEARRKVEDARKKQQ